MVDLNMKLSRNFWLKEMIRSETATRLGIDNTEGLTEEVVENLRQLCLQVLQPLRDHYNRVVSISSGYRCLKLNRKLKSSDDSDHRFGYATDLEIFGISNVEVATWIYKNVPFHQVILEFYDGENPNSGWVHVSYHHDLKNRGEGLIINSKGRQIWTPN